MGLACLAPFEIVCGQFAPGLTPCHENKVSLPRPWGAVFSVGGCEWLFLTGLTRKSWSFWRRGGSGLTRSRRRWLSKYPICGCLQAVGHGPRLIGVKRKGNDLFKAVSVFDRLGRGGGLGEFQGAA